MKGYQILVRGRWGHFRRVETNNNPLTHDFLTKTALIGLMGAVLGIERNEMRPLFPKLSREMLYGVQVNGPVKKESWAFTLRDAFRHNDPKEKSPRQMEFLRDPEFKVTLALKEDADAEAVRIFDRFAHAVRVGESCYPPVLGLHNCPAELEWIQEGDIAEADGEYQTKGFFLRSHKIKIKPEQTAFRLGFERIPTYQSDNWVNPLDQYKEVVYPSNGGEVRVEGTHYILDPNEEAWCLL